MCISLATGGSRRATGSWPQIKNFQYEKDKITQMASPKTQFWIGLCSWLLVFSTFSTCFLLGDYSTMFELILTSLHPFHLYLLFIVLLLFPFVKGSESQQLGIYIKGVIDGGTAHQVRFHWSSGVTFLGNISSTHSA